MTQEAIPISCMKPGETAGKVVHKTIEEIARDVTQALHGGKLVALYEIEAPSSGMKDSKDHPNLLAIIEKQY